MRHTGGPQGACRSTAASAEPKRCPRCRLFYEVIVGVTFNRNNSSIVSDGLQILCRECDERRKATDPDYGWAVFQRVLVKEGVMRQWEKATYLGIVALDLCHWCGAHLSDWGKGHNIDRISSARLHVPDNCIACCSACNWAKGSMSSAAWCDRIEGILGKYPRGKVPWEDLDPKGPKHAKIPDLSTYVVEVQLTLGIA